MDQYQLVPVAGTGSTDSVTSTGLLITLDSAYQAIAIQVKGANTRLRVSKATIVAADADNTDREVVNGDTFELVFGRSGNALISVVALSGTAEVVHTYCEVERVAQ